MKPQRTKIRAVIRNCLVAQLCALAMIMALDLSVAASAPDERAKFEQALEDTFPGSYTLYNALNGEAQNKVFREYKKTDKEAGIARFSPVIAKILELAITQGQAPQRSGAHQ